MVSRILIGLVICVGFEFVALKAVMANEQDFVVMANQAKVGSLNVTQKEDQITIKYAINSNGRGPQLTEKIVLAPTGIPISWTVDGRSLMGGSVQESMSFSNGITRWTSQADSGEVVMESPMLYIGNDASPWVFGQYARILLKEPTGKLDVLPSGTISIEKVGKLMLRSHSKILNAYVLSGVTLTPKFLLLDDTEKLFAVLDDNLLVEQGYESAYEELKRFASDLNLEYLGKLQKKLAHRNDNPVRLRNVHVFNPATGKRGGLVNVTFFDGKITSIDKETDINGLGADEIDGKHGTLISGLHDMHVHNTMWSGLFHIAAGITTTRDMGNENTSLLELQRKIEAGELAGPDIVRAGLLEGKSPFSAHAGFLPSDLEEAKTNIRWYADRGYRYIKLYNSINPDWIKPLVDEAHRLGLAVLGHVPAFSTPNQVLNAGYDEITHINQLMLGWLINPAEDTRTSLRLTALSLAADLDLASASVRHTIELMKARKVGLDTTLSIVEQIMMSRTGEVPEGAAAYLGHLPIGYQRYRKRSYVKFADAAEQQRYADAFAKILQIVSILHKEGVKLWPGTDDNSGFLLHRELELYVKAGMTPAEVLRMATLDCELYLGRGQTHGLIERGHKADFFLVPGDPTLNIGELHRIRMVVKGGTIYYPDEIYRALNIVPFIR